MDRIGAANGNSYNLGLEVVEEDGQVFLNFDLPRIDAYKARFGEEVFLEQGMRHFEERANALGAEHVLWLWRESVEALVAEPVRKALRERAESEGTDNA